MVNQQVIKHFKNRLDEAKNELMRNIPRITEMSGEDKIAALKAGNYTATLDPWKGVHISYHEEKEELENYNNKKNEVMAEYNKVLDQLYLADEPNLLEMLGAFRNIKV